MIFKLFRFFCEFKNIFIGFSFLNNFIHNFDSLLVSKRIYTMFTNSGGNVVLRFVGSVCSPNFARRSAVGGRRSVFLRFSRDRLLTQISSAVGGRRSAVGGRRPAVGKFIFGIIPTRQNCDIKYIREIS